MQVTDVVVPTVFADFDDYWTPFLSAQAPAPAYVASLGETAPHGAARGAARAAATGDDGSIRSPRAPGRYVAARLGRSARPVAPASSTVALAAASDARAQPRKTPVLPLSATANAIAGGMTVCREPVGGEPQADRGTPHVGRGEAW